VRTSPPFTVISYVALTTALALPALVYRGIDANSAVGAVVLAAALLALLTGAFVAWVLLVIVELSFYVLVVTNTPAWWWWVVPIKLLLFALLVSPPTWRHVRPSDAGMA
jgi:hypothetical protein